MRATYEDLVHQNADLKVELVREIQRRVRMETGVRNLLEAIELLKREIRYEA